MQCKQHPTYTATVRPNVNCNECWAMYCEAHNESWDDLLKSLKKFGENECSRIEKEQSYGKSKKRKKKTKTR